MSTDESDEPSASSTVDSLVRAVAGAPAVSTVGFDSGRAFGPFVIERILGEGANGSVYLARDSRLDRAVGLKIPRRAGDVERQRFLREARVVANVSHRGIATIYEVGEHDGHAYIAMEYVVGETLRARLRGRKPGGLPEGDALRILRAIAEAVAAAHAAGIVHRDLKPENVMVAEDGSVRVVDFGLAKPIAGAASASDSNVDMLTTDGDVLGTPGYMAPEQIAGDTADARADVFALGVIGYELLRGERPFRGKTSLEVAASTARDDAPSLAGSGYDARVVRVLSRCLQRDRARRFVDAGEVVRALSQTNATKRLRAVTAAGVLLLGIAGWFALARRSSADLLPAPPPSAPPTESTGAVATASTRPLDPALPTAADPTVAGSAHAEAPARRVKSPTLAASERAPVPAASSLAPSPSPTARVETGPLDDQK